MGYDLVGRGKHTAELEKSWSENPFFQICVLVIRLWLREDSEKEKIFDYTLMTSASLAKPSPPPKKA